MTNQIASIRPLIIGRHRLYLADCGDVLPTLGEVHALVTDPPYGFGYDRLAAKTSGKRPGPKSAARRGTYARKQWDNQTADDLLAEALRLAAHAIVWGGNYYDLGPSPKLLIWYKHTGKTTFSDAEVAWTNLKGPTLVKEHLWNGMIRARGEARNGHPTQKPLDLMSWCIHQLPDDAEVIFDPFMGSGTTGVAAHRCGKTFIGIERDPDFFAIAEARMREAVAERTLF